MIIVDEQQIHFSLQKLDPKIHWDPDVIAALDDDEFDYDADENALDDDFMLQANGIQPLADEECDEFEYEKKPIVDELL